MQFLVIKKDAGVLPNQLTDVINAECRKVHGKYLGHSQSVHNERIIITIAYLPIAKPADWHDSPEVAPIYNQD